MCWFCPFVCVYIPVYQPDSTGNANLDPPTPADREVPNHGWRFLCVQGFLWMGSQGVLITAQMRMQMRTANRGFPKGTGFPKLWHLDIASFSAVIAAGIRAGKGSMGLDWRQRRRSLKRLARMASQSSASAHVSGRPEFRFNQIPLRSW